MTKITLEQKWHLQSEDFKGQAQKLPYGKDRDALMRMARELETASHLHQWLMSAELQPPK